MSYVMFVHCGLRALSSFSYSPQIAARARGRVSSARKKRRAKRRTVERGREVLEVEVAPRLELAVVLHQHDRVRLGMRHVVRSLLSRRQAPVTAICSIEQQLLVGNLNGAPQPKFENSQASCHGEYARLRPAVRRRQQFLFSILFCLRATSTLSITAAKVFHTNEHNVSGSQV